MECICLHKVPVSFITAQYIKMQVTKVSTITSGYLMVDCGTEAKIKFSNSFRDTFPEHGSQYADGGGKPEKNSCCNACALINM